MPIDPDDYYGRQQFVTWGRSDLVAAYDYYGEQLDAMATTIDFSTFGLTIDEVRMVRLYYNDDHPETFWTPTSFSYSYSSATNVRLKYTYTVTAEERASYEQQLDKRSGELLEGITSAMSLEERKRLIHDRLILAADYDDSLNAAFTHDLIGVLLNGTGVCESYSTAYQYLMYQVGINVAQVRGTGDGGAHIWNTVEIGGEWRMVDVTWDDDGGTAISYDFYDFDAYSAPYYRHRIELEYKNDVQISYTPPAYVAYDEAAMIAAATTLSSVDVETMAPVIATGIENKQLAYFRLTNGLTAATLEAQLQANGYAVLWDLVYAIDTYLSEEDQLGYSITYQITTIDEANGIVTVMIYKAQ